MHADNSILFRSVRTENIFPFRFAMFPSFEDLFRLSLSNDKKNESIKRKYYFAPPLADVVHTPLKTPIIMFIFIFMQLFILPQRLPVMGDQGMSMGGGGGVIALPHQRP